MRPIATDVAHLSVCWAHRWAVQKRLNRLWARLGDWLMLIQGTISRLVNGVKIGRIHSPPRGVTWCDVAYCQNTQDTFLVLFYLKCNSYTRYTK